MADISKQVVKLGGKDYVQVAGRILVAVEEGMKAGFRVDTHTEVANETDKIIRIKATVSTARGTATGYAESDKVAGKGVEKESPLEVAETSAVGRALAFLGYAVENGIASFEEIQKAEARRARLAEAAQTTVTTAPAPAVTPLVEARPIPMPKQAPVAAPKRTKQAPPETYTEDTVPACSDCTKAIEAVATGAGILPAHKVANMTNNKFKRPLCADCSAKAQQPPAA